MSELVETPDTSDMPMMFRHCCTVFSKMEEQASYDDASGIVMWEGVLTALITNECHLSLPYYTSTTRILKALGCIRQLRRGGGTAQSQWEIIKFPEADEYNKLMATGGANAIKNQARPSRTTMVEQQVRELNEKMEMFEKVLEEIISLLDQQPSAEEGAS